MKISEERFDVLQRFITWREKHIKDKQFILILSLLVGVFTALAAYVLKFLVEYIKELLTDWFNPMEANWLYLVYPVVSRIKRHNMWSSVCASAITIGCGGSVGAEAPIVLTGSAIGSNLGSLFRLDHKTLMLLVGCGAAGAVSGIFKAPIAGLVFTLEVLMIDLTMASLLPLLITSVTAASVSYLLTGTEAMFQFHLDYPFSLERIPHAIALGIFCGLVAWYFTRAMNWIENIFRRYSNPYVKFAIGGTMLSILIFLFPPLYGEGYDTISLLLNGTTEYEWDTVMNNSLFYGNSHLLVPYLFLIILFKVFASSATNGGGGCGGIFAPSLFLGCIAGFVFSYVCNEFHIGDTYVPEKNFALMGMAGLMSGVMHAPLTGVFLIAELTGGYGLFLPLMIVSVCAYLTIIVFEPHSIYSMRLAKKGELITHHKDRAVLTLMNIESIVETDFLKVRPDMDLGEMVKTISKSSRNLFPVVDVNDELIGIVELDDIRNIIFRQELYHRYWVEGFMKKPKARIVKTDSMEEVMKKFDTTKAWNLPVVDEENRYLGFVSKSKMLNTYRQVLVDLVVREKHKQESNMEKKDLRIVYMGTPEFAVESLKRLVEGGYNVVGVITMPDKPMGRHGSVLQPSPVKAYAVSQGLKVLQPEKLKDEAFLEELRALRADLQIVVAFRMLPEAVWQMPRLGTFNLHASLLPQYRGAAPINWAVINGDTETGITTFFLKHEIDTGEIIDQVRVPIADTDNVGVVYDRLMMLGGDLVLKTVDAILAGNVKTIPQETFSSTEPLRPAPKIFKDTCRIDWTKGVKPVYDFIRGLSPYPAAWTELCEPDSSPVTMKIYESSKEFVEHTFAPGTILTDKKTYFKVASTDGFVHLLSVQLAGKKRMNVTDFLRGYRYSEKAILK